MQTRSGAHFTFDLQYESILRDQWNSDKLNPWLRVVLITAAMIYHEQGASRLRILRLIGNTDAEIIRKDSPHCYGCASDVSVLEVIDARVKDRERIMKERFPRARWITARINALFPFGDGSKETASYNGDHIHLEVPIGGYRKESQVLALWGEFGSTGIIKPPPENRRR